MMVNFDFSNATQTMDIESKIQNKLFHSVHTHANNKKWIRIAGIGLGITSAFLKITACVACIGEHIIKMFGNLIGSSLVAITKHLSNKFQWANSFYDNYQGKFSFSKGGEQFIDLFAKIIETAAWIVQSPLQIGYVTYHFATKPTEKLPIIFS